MYKKLTYRLWLLTTTTKWFFFKTSLLEVLHVSYFFIISSMFSFVQRLDFHTKNNIIKLHILIWFHFKQPDNVGIWHIPSLFTSKSRIWWHLSIIWGLAYLSWHPILLWTNYILSIRPFLTAGSHVYSLHSLPAPEWMHGGWYPFSLKSAGMRLQIQAPLAPIHFHRSRYDLLFLVILRVTLENSIQR